MDNQKKEENKNEIAQTEFKSDNVILYARQLPDCQVTFSIHISPKATLAAYKKAVKSINKEVSLPGFRKGKAPEAMIVQNYNSYIDQEWKEVLVQTAFKEAMTLSKLYPLNEETIKKPRMKSATKEDGADIDIEFESAPQIPDIPPNELKLKRVEKEDVTQEQIDESLENIRLHHAVWHDVEDREVQEGDYIDIDIQHEETPEHYICKDTRFEVAEGKMGDWMRRIVIGKKINDVVSGMSEPSAEIDSKTEFTPTNCRITIKAIKTATLPGLDDELAKKVGLSRIDELKEKVVANLNNQADEEVRQQLREQLEQLILEKYPFDIPGSLVKREVKNRLNFLKREMKKSDHTSESIEQKVEEVKAAVELEVKRAFQLFFIARRIGDENNIKVTQDELVKELMMQMYTKESTLDSSLDPEEARSKVYINLLSQKVKDFLISRAQIE